MRCKLLLMHHQKQIAPLCCCLMAVGEWCNVWFYLKPARGSTGSGGDSHAASEQPHPAGELPEAHGAAERPDRDWEPNGSRPGECADTKRRVGGAGWQDITRWLSDCRISSERAVCTSSPRRGCSRGCSSWLVPRYRCFKWPNSLLLVLILNFVFSVLRHAPLHKQRRDSNQSVQSARTAATPRHDREFLIWNS